LLIDNYTYALTLALGEKMPSALQAKHESYDFFLFKKLLTGGQRIQRNCMGRFSAR